MLTEFKKLSAYWEGYAAAQIGEDIRSNPHWYNPEYTAWDYGWCLGKSEKALDPGPKTQYNKENPNQRATRGSEL